MLETQTNAAQGIAIAHNRPTVSDPLVFFQENANWMCCPICQGDLKVSSTDIKCAKCSHAFSTADGIPQLFWQNDWDSSKKDVTEQMKAFYETTPFPNYDDFDSVASLLAKARRSVFADLLDQQIPYGARVIECGCGTGQMSSFLSVANRTVIGADMCMNSLRLGQAFKQRNTLNRVHFVQMNLFRPVFKPQTFDVVISNGVLHHTADPEMAFQSISRLVKKGGFIVIGLYHHHGRFITDLRRSIFNLMGDRFKFLDPNLRNKSMAAAKKRAWFMDQYKNPHESKHTITEVLQWLKPAGFQFVKSVPRFIPFKPFSEKENLFAPERAPTRAEALLVELGMIPKGSREGGFFTMVAQKIV